MKDYDVYALGNALVDMEYRTTDEELASLKVDKGVMTLVDEEQQQALISGLGRDPLKRACGGSAANSMIAVSQLGGKSFYSCKIADDEIGRFYAEDLQRNGVDSNLHVAGHSAGKTGQCLVMVTPDAERSMCTYLGITGDLTTEELDTDRLLAARYLYIEGYLVSSDTARDAVIEARKKAEASDVTVSMTLSDPNMVQFFGDGLREMLGGGVDLLLCNEQEALTFAGTESLEEAVAALRAVSRTFAITLGARGSLIFDGENTTTVPARKARPVDTNGAGDMFAGAFLYGITHGLDYARSAELANAGAGRLIQEYGPRMSAELTRAVRDEVLGAS